MPVPNRATNPRRWGRTISDHLELELRNLTRSFEEMRSDLLPEVAAMLTTAPRVWFLGFGDEEGVASVGRSVFARLRHGVHQLQGSGQSWAAELSMTGPRDVLMVLTFEPRPKVLRPLLAHAPHHAHADRHRHRSRLCARRRSGFPRSFAALAHVASYGISCRPTRRCPPRFSDLFAVAYLGRNAEAVSQRIATLSAIDEELDLY